MAEATPRPEVAERMQLLRESYSRQLKERFGDLLQMAQRLRAEVDPADIKALHFWLHSQAGSAGTFGFPALGSAARALEIDLKHHIDADQLQDESWRRDFSRRLLSLESLLEFTTPLNADRSAPLPAVASAVPEIPAPGRGLRVITSRHSPRLHLNPPSLWVLSTDLREAEHLISVLGEFGFLVQHFLGLSQVDQALECEMPLAMIIDIDQMGERSTESSTLEMLKAWRRRCPEQLQILFISDRQDFDTLMTLTAMGAAGYLCKPFDIPRLMDIVEKLFPTEGEQAYRVLLIDDDQLLSRYYQGALEAAGMTVCVLESPHNVLNVMSDFRPDVVLLDLNMPEFSGDQIARMLRLHNGWPEVPVIYFSAEQDPDRQMAVQEQAGDDFLTKPVMARQLVSAITVRARRSRMLNRIMSTDSLTSLLKHSAIKERLDIECRRAERNRSSLSVAMIDIDKFKHINDTWGHATGDRVIKALAHLLKNRLRTTDVVGRYGGDEFMVMLPDSKGRDVVGVLSEIADRFRHIQFDQRGETFGCTLSIGIADSLHYPSPSHLIEAADNALFEVKRLGRNAVRLAETGAQEEAAGGH